MEDKLNPTAVGAFVLLLGVALVASVLWLAAGFNGRQKTTPYRSVVSESVAGLNVNAPVKYLGVDVGKVESIGIDPQNTRQVVLGLQIAQGTPVKQDSEAVLKTQGLTGIAYVEISGGSASSPTLAAGDDGVPPTIRSKPSLSARLENVLTTVLARVDHLSETISAFFDDETRVAFKQTLTNAATVSHALASQDAAIRNGLADGARTARLAAEAGKQLTPTLNRVSAGAQALQDMSDETAKASVRVGIAADAAASGVQQLRNETLPEMTRLIAEVNELAATVRRLSEQTERSPSSLLVGAPPRPPGPGERINKP